MKKTAYITTSPAALSHTFIRREIKELRALGADILLFGIRPDISNRLTDKDLELIRGTAYLYPLRISGVIFANFWFIFKKPVNYFRALSHAIFNEEFNIIQHLKLIYHFFVSASIALEIERSEALHIHAHFTNVASTIAMYASLLSGISFSITLHSAGTIGLPSVIGLRRKIAFAKFLFAVCEYTRTYYDRIFHCGNKTFLVHCGIDPGEYKRAFEPRASSRDMKIRLIAVGRIEEKKGFIYLIEACRLLARESIKFRLVIIGDGPLRNALEEKAQSYGLGESVIFKGSCPESVVMEELEKSDICVVPSVTAASGEMEGIPVVIMEALALSIPVVATGHSGIPEIIKDRETGLLVPEKDPSALAGEIKLLMQDIQVKNTCITNGRKIILEEFNIKNTAMLKKRIFEENT